ncbi:MULTISPECIES: hypothetical protein [unclassified Caballeronia]|uniref:hypothetical protein n=1 Tax=unclassified Caballeronia TaxID=2646786 RepID=UPI00285D859E|nr:MULTISPECIES: hypothetical protein [unclassified Caballeronia]MDR5777005.1 hypothetical protein [Caballeronia sp. LZ002]MDR5852420.1 hypothetical protein [Caballeronia sp. LZ003]
MTNVKEQKQQVFIRLPLPVKDWLFSEALAASDSQRKTKTVPSVVIDKLVEASDEAMCEHGEELDSAAKAEKDSLCIRIPVSLYDRLFSESMNLSKLRRVSLTVPSLVVEKLRRLHLQAQAAKPQSSASTVD